MSQRIAISALILSAAAASASGAVINSGVAPWQIEGGPASVITNPLPPSTWAAAPPAAWIGFDSETSQSSGEYVFSIAIGAYLGSGGSFAFNFAADNTIQWSITNGTLDGDVTCTNGGDCYSRLRYLTGTFSADSILTATIINDEDDLGPNPSGLLVQGVAVDTPEPGTYALFSIAGAAGFYLRRRRAN